MVAKKGAKAYQGSTGSQTRGKVNKRTGVGKKRPSAKGGRPIQPIAGDPPVILVPTQDPIIITGGSLFLQYANSGSDSFADDGSGGGKKKLKHKKNSLGPIELTVIEFKNRGGQTLLPPIDLKALKINRNCQIIIHYDL